VPKFTINFEEILLLAHENLEEQNKVLGLLDELITRPEKSYRLW